MEANDDFRSIVTDLLLPNLESSSTTVQGRPKETFAAPIGVSAKFLSSLGAKDIDVSESHQHMLISSLQKPRGYLNHPSFYDSTHTKSSKVSYRDWISPLTYSTLFMHTSAQITPRHRQFWLLHPVRCLLDCTCTPYLQGERAALEQAKLPDTYDEQQHKFIHRPACSFVFDVNRAHH